MVDWVNEAESGGGEGEGKGQERRYKKGKIIKKGREVKREKIR